MADVKDVIVRKPTAEEEAECKTWPTWSCDISNFPWEYQQKETCLILEGEVTVTNQTDDGESVSFGPGDYVEFPQGFECIWRVAKPVKKHYKFG